MVASLSGAHEPNVEAESIYGRLFELDRTRARQFVQALRDIASLGRKQGIALVIATQTGTSGVFDAPTRRNLGNTLIFRSEAIVGDQFGVPRAAGLATLPSGTAYALKYGAVVEFPLSSRPTLPHASLYHEDDATLLLTADAEADGLGDNDLPDGTTDTTVYRSEVPQNGGNGGGHNGIPVSVPQDVPPVENDKKLIYTRWKALQSLKAVERELYGQAGGVKFYWVRDAVNEMRLRRGQAPI